MKSILLTTTAIVAFAGAAAADGHSGVSFSGDATLGFNDDQTSGFGEDNGFYWDANLNIAMSAALDNGLTAGVDFGIEIDDEEDDNYDLSGLNNDYLLVSNSFVLSLTSEDAGIYFGDTAFAAETQWSSAGDMEADGFSEADGEVALRGDVTVAGVSASISYAVANADGLYVSTDTTEATDQLSLGVSGDVGMFTFAAAYQEESQFAPYFSGANGDFTDAEVFGISAGTSVAGADIKVAYAQTSAFGVDPELTSLGVEVAYPFGPVTATVYYVSEDTSAGDVDDNYGLTVAYADGPIAVTGKIRNEQGRDEWNIDGSYDVGNGLTVLAGALNENEGDDFDYYVGGTYDLGGGAELLAVFAEDADNDQEDEIGAGEYMPGTTVALTFSF